MLTSVESHVVWFIHLLLTRSLSTSFLHSFFFEKGLADVADTDLNFVLKFRLLLFLSLNAALQVYATTSCLRAFSEL